MIRTDLQEAVDLVGLVCARLNALPVDAASGQAADLRRATGMLAADAEYTIGSLDLPARKTACFDLALAAGATFAGLYALREAIAAARVDGRYAAIVQQGVGRLAIVQMAERLRQTVFQSRDAVVTVQAQMNAVFAAAEDEAADALDADTYRALVSLHAAVTQDLTSRARPLPRIVPYTLQAPIPVLVLAQRLYGDASRAPELVAENRMRAPLFAPLTGRALSA